MVASHHNTCSARARRIRFVGWPSIVADPGLSVVDLDNSTKEPYITPAAFCRLHMAHYNVERSALVHTAPFIEDCSNNAIESRPAVGALRSVPVDRLLVASGRGVFFFASGRGSIHTILERLADFVEKTFGVPIS
jgi:hypothetical protein